MKWVPWDAAAFLEGVIGLDAEERGFYVTLICLQYARAPLNHVTDELVIKAMACRPQVWRRVKAGLITKGKVHDVDGKLIANRVETQVQTQLKLMRNHTSIDPVSGGQPVKKQKVNSPPPPDKSQSQTQKREHPAPTGLDCSLSEFVETADGTAPARAPLGATRAPPPVLPKTAPQAVAEQSQGPVNYHVQFKHHIERYAQAIIAEQELAAAVAKTTAMHAAGNLKASPELQAEINFGTGRRKRNY